MILAGILCGLTAAAMWFAYRAHQDHTSTLDSLGRRYNLQRDPGESNASYKIRLRNRIAIRGFPRW